MAISTFAITASPVYSSCLSSKPELYDYTGKYDSPRRIISLQLVTPSGQKSCELISKDDAILLAKEASSFKEFYDGFLDSYDSDGNPIRIRKYIYTFTIGKCDNLLVNIWQEGKPEFGKKGELNFRLTILPFKPSVSRIINALPVGLVNRPELLGFDISTISSAQYRINCQKDGERIESIRKFIADTPKAEIIYTREISFSEIKSQ